MEGTERQNRNIVVEVGSKPKEGTQWKWEEKKEGREEGRRIWHI